MYLTVRQQEKPPPGPSFLDTLRTSSVPRARRPHDRSHPAYAPDHEKVPEEVTPSLKEARSALSDLMGHAVQVISANADRKAAKLARGASASSTSKSHRGGISKPPRKPAPTIRREHTAEDLLIPDAHPLRSRLRSCATDPSIPASSSAPVDKDERTVAKSSRPPALLTLFKSRIDEPDYEFPSSTPTPPAKPRIRDRSWNATFSSSSSSSYSGSSSSPSLLSGLPRHERFPRQEPTEMSALYHENTESPVHSDSIDVSMVDESSGEPDPHDNVHEVPPVPYVPSPPLSLPSTSMPPPPAPVSRPDPILPNLHAPSLTPASASLSRPFVPPSQVPSGTQPERPRPSQRQKTLGMRPIYGQGTKFQSKSKPFKVPFAVKKPSGSSGSGSGSGSGSRAVQRVERSMSPVIPDPPYIAARVAQAEAEHEMTARRPEPPRADEDEDEGPKDANSSADMWAALDEIDCPAVG